MRALSFGGIRISVSPVSATPGRLSAFFPLLLVLLLVFLSECGASTVAPSDDDPMGVHRIGSRVATCASSELATLADARIAYPFGKLARPMSDPYVVRDIALGPDVYKVDLNVCSPVICPSRVAGNPGILPAACMVLTQTSGEPKLMAALGDASTAAVVEAADGRGMEIAFSNGDPCGVKNVFGNERRHSMLLHVRCHGDSGETVLQYGGVDEECRHTLVLYTGEGACAFNSARPSPPTHVAASATSGGTSSGAIAAIVLLALALVATLALFLVVAQRNGWRVSLSGRGGERPSTTGFSLLAQSDDDDF